MLRRGGTLRGRTDRGLYFPINHRIVDLRVSPEAATHEMQVQSRYRRELRTNFTTGETRQTRPPAWSAAARPTHFVSLPLPTKNVLVGRVERMQDAMRFADEGVANLFVPLPKLHVTLSVLTVPEGEAATEKLKNIRQCVEEAGRELERMGPLRLRFRGLGTFGDGRVVFARCIAEEHFSRLDHTVQRLRRDLGSGLGIDVKGNPHDSYVPHITVMKIRANQQKQYGRRVPMSVWADFQHHDFGDVAFNRLDVCKMKGGSRDGYYDVECSARIA